jgi:mxaA protein
MTLIPPGSVAQTAIRSFEIATPRPYGYVIGDVFEQRITLSLNTPYRLQRDALPAPGRIDRWLALRDPRLELVTQAGFTEYRLTLGYQILSAPQHLSRLFAPGLDLAFSDGEQVLHFPVPGFAYAVAPLIPAQDLGEGAALGLRPARRPPPIPIAPHLWRLALIGAGLGVLGLLLAYLYWVVPFLGRSHGPFARAWRELRACARRPPGADRDRAALRVLHRAFDQSAGRALFGEDLDGFFRDHPRFAPARGAIEALFEASRGVFFDPHRPLAAPALDQLLALCRRCRDLERGLR